MVTVPSTQNLNQYQLDRTGQFIGERNVIRHRSGDLDTISMCHKEKSHASRAMSQYSYITITTEGYKPTNILRHLTMTTILGPIRYATAGERRPIAV